MTKTIENLKAAITGESTASATYAAYAAKAAQEGQPLIQKLFEAASKAESVHAANHNKVLEKLGATMEPIDIQIHVGTTAENLKAAIAGETHEFESMYPEFIAVAEEEGQKAAVRSFTWATEAEKEHADFYSVALKALESGDTSSLPRQYWICLVCGDTFKSLEGVDACPSAAPRLKNSSSSDKFRLSTGGRPRHPGTARNIPGGFLFLPQQSMEENPSLFTEAAHTGKSFSNILLAIHFKTLIIFLRFKQEAFFIPPLR